jgi:hypothetical protein
MYQRNPLKLDGLSPEAERQVNEEFDKIANALQAMQVDHLEMREHNVAPDKPREGYIYKADGSDWDPGSGTGIYEYNTGAWVKL